MSAQLDLLGDLLPPPGVPVTSPPWDLSLAEVGFEFPQDYRDFIDLYGSGRISSEEKIVSVTIGCPVLPSRPGEGGLAGFVAAGRAEASEFNGFYPGGDQQARLPESGALLEWGSTGDGDTFCWLMNGPDPNAWTVVELPRHEDRVYRFEGGMVAFLLALLRNRFPTAPYYIGAGPKWTMEGDWLRHDLEISAGPSSE